MTNNHDACMIKLLALDIDDTLTDEVGLIDNECLSSIRKAQSKGIQVVLLSARPPAGVDDVARLLDGQVYRACYLGAVIQDPNLNDIQRLLIDIDVARDIARFADNHRFNLTITVDDAEYQTQEQACEHPNSVKSVVSAESVLLPDTPPVLIGVSGYLPASLLYQYCADYHSKSVCTTRHFDLNYVHSTTLITHPAGQKRDALLTLCRLLSTNPKEVLAIGDSESDVGMLQVAGIAVTVANAHPYVQKAATLVAPAPRGEGVIWALRRLLREDHNEFI